MKFRAFTLAELLIALTILGVIATFTIPKILMAQQQSANKAVGKEAVATISQIFQQIKADEKLTINTSSADFTPYMNYVSVSSTAIIDGAVGQTSFPCNSGICLKLHNGGMMAFGSCPFANLGSGNMLAFVIDPDGNYSGGTTGPGKALVFFIYADGKLKDWENVLPSSTYCYAPYGPNPGTTPTWFSWN